MSFVGSQLVDLGKVNQKSDLKSSDAYRLQNEQIEKALNQINLAQESRSVEVSFEQGLKSYIEAHIIISKLDGTSLNLNALKVTLERLQRLNEIAIEQNVDGLIEETSFERGTQKLFETGNQFMSGFSDVFNSMDIFKSS